MNLKRTNTASSKNGEACSSQKQSLRGQSSNHSRNGNPEFQTPMQQKNSNLSGSASIKSAMGYQTNPDAQKAPLIQQNQKKLYSSNQANAKLNLLKVAKTEANNVQGNNSNLGGILSSENASTLPSTSAKNRLSLPKTKISPHKRGKQASVDFGSSAKKSNYSSGHKVNQSFDLSMFVKQERNLAESIIEEEENYKFQTLNTDESSQSFNQLRLKEKNANANDQRTKIGKIYRVSEINDQDIRSKNEYDPNVMSNTHANSETAAATNGSKQRRKSQQIFQTQINQILGQRGKVIDKFQEEKFGNQTRNQQANLSNKKDLKYATELSTQSRHSKKVSYINTPEEQDLSSTSLNEVQKNISIAEEQISKLFKETKALRSKFMVRQKLVSNLSKLFDKEIDGNYLLQDLMRFKDQNEVLRQRYKSVVEQNEEIKLILRCQRNESINKNLEVQENLRKVIADINILEKSYFRMKEDIYYLERQISDKRKIEQSASQISSLQAQKQDLIDSRKFYRSQIQRIKADLASHQEDFQGFVKHENDYSTYKTKTLAIITLKRTLQKLQKIENLSQKQEFLDNLRQNYIASRKEPLLLNILRRQNIIRNKIKTDDYFRLWMKATLNQKKVLYQAQEKLNEKQRNSIQYSCFYKWRELLAKRQSHLSSQRMKAIKFLEACSLRIHRKSICNAFLIWKNLNQEKSNCLLKLRNVIMTKKRKDLRWAFNFWNKEFNYHADKLQCFSMLQKRSTKQLKARAFYGLREAIKLQKLDNFQLKVKFYKEWRYRYFQSLYVKNMQPGKLGFRLIKLGSEQLLVQRVFNTFRKNCLQNKQDRAQKRHKLEVEFKTEACLVAQKREESHSKSRSLKVFKKCILRWQGLRIRNFFEYWRGLIVNYKRFNQISLYRKLANFKLNQAFGEWKYKAQQARNNQKLISNDQSYSNAQEKQKQIEVLKDEIEQINSVRMTLAKSRILKAATHQEKLRMKDAFSEWRIKMLLGRKQIGRLRVVFAKIFQNKKRIYFQRYQRQARKASKYLNHDSILSKYESILHLRLQRYFLSVLQYNKQVGDEKRNYLRRIASVKQRKSQQHAFKQWTAALNQSQISFVNSIEMDQINCYSSVMQEVVTKQSNLQDQNCAITKCEKTLAKFGASNIAKYIKRVKNYQESKAFDTWKQQSIKFKSQKRCLKHFMLLMKKNDIRIMFVRWKEQAHSHNMLVLNSRINYIDSSLSRNTRDHKQNCEDLSQRKEKLVARLQIENISVNKYSKIQQGIVGILFRQKNDLIETKLHHWVLRNWRARNQQLKQKFKRLEIMLSNYSKRQGFDSINKIYGQFNLYLHNKQHMRETQLSRVAAMLFKGFIRSAFSQWRAHSYYNVNSQREQRHLNIIEIQEQMRQNRSNHKIQIIQLLDVNRKSISLQNIFEAWRSVNNLQTLFKAKTKVMLFNKRRLDLSGSLQRWTRMSKKSKLHKQKIINFQKKQSSKLQIKAYQLLRIACLQQKEQRLLLKNSLDLLIKKKLGFSFNAILSFTSQKTISILEQKQRSVDKICRVAISHHLNKQKFAFSQWMSNTRLLKLQQLKVKSIIRLSCYHKRRAFGKWSKLGYFYNHKKECELFSTVQQEILQNRIKKQALIELITKKEKIVNAHQIQNILDKVKESHFNKMKSLLFILRNINSESQASDFCLYKSFQLLKQSASHKREIKIKLKNVLSRKCDYPRYCFVLWKNLQENLENHFFGLKRDALVKAQSCNALQRKIIEKREDVTEVQQYSLYSQSEMMDNNLHIARRLALRLLKKRDSKYLQQSLSIWKQVNDDESKQNLVQKIEKRQQILNQLMTQASIIEKSNSLMSDQNHDYRNQNVMAILKGEDLVQSSKENQAMMLELADKNLQIKRLFEENRNLSIRLGQINLNNSMIRQKTLAQSRS